MSPSELGMGDGQASFQEPPMSPDHDDPEPVSETHAK